jgi:hypothetical protein
MTVFFMVPSFRRAWLPARRPHGKERPRQRRAVFGLRAGRPPPNAIQPLRRSDDRPAHGASKTARGDIFAHVVVELGCGTSLRSLSRQACEICARISLVPAKGAILAAGITSCYWVATAGIAEPTAARIDARSDRTSSSARARRGSTSSAVYLRKCSPWIAFSTAQGRCRTERRRAIPTSDQNSRRRGLLMPRRQMVFPKMRKEPGRRREGRCGGGARSR